MASRLLPSPAFGKADLSNCEREQIHLAGSIQPFGALLVVDDAMTIVQTSANARDFLGLSAPILGRNLGDIEGDLMQRIVPHLEDALTEIPAAVRCGIGDPPVPFDGLLHRLPTGDLVIEVERAGPDLDLTRHIDQALKTIMGCPSLLILADETARLVRDLTGFDRVMVYRFDEEGHGEVFAECKKAELDPFLGNWYPASDIPQIARRLYERNRVRVLADVNYVPAPVEPAVSPATGCELDMSLCVLRSMSPLHIKYLQNMGVGATLVMSLMVGGKLWGLVSCHHYGPKLIHFELRAVAELLAEAVAVRIAALDAFVQAQAELSVRRLEQRMVDAISRDGDWRAALFDSSQTLLLPVGAEGAALLLDDQILTAGEVPGTQQIRAVRAWLGMQPRASVVATSALPDDVPDLAALMPEIFGLMAVPISQTSGDYLIWFRPERIKTLTWGGNPFKPFVIGNDPSDLSPRRSFAQWHQLVEGTSEPWSPADLVAGQSIGETIADVVLQFRTVRMLIVQDQLMVASGQVQSSQQPVVIADAQGKILLINGSFNTLIGEAPAPTQLSDLSALFTDPATVGETLHDLQSGRRPFRGEVALGEGSSAVPLLMRADPVFSSPGRVLGFVLLFLDISERRSAEAARRHFQDSLMAPHRFGTSRLRTAADPIYQLLLSTAIENAQVAALEITDSIDTAHIPDMLDSIRRSVERSADVLERLVWHATR